MASAPYVGWIFSIWRFARGGWITNNASIHTRTSFHCTRAQLLDISNIQEQPSLRADLSFPRENVVPIPANSPRCEERRAIARPLLDLECKFEICLESSDRAPVFR